MPKNAPSSEKFNETKNALLRHYGTNRASRGVHLVGFTAGLFTLIQTVQYAHKEGARLSEIFLDWEGFFSKLVQGLGDLKVLSNWLAPAAQAAKFLLFLIAVGGLLFMIIRTIFRFAVWAYFATYLKRVSPSEISKSTDPIHWAIHMAAANKIIEDRKKVYGFVPLSWFITGLEGSHPGRGFILCLFLAFVSTLFLVGVLW